MTEQKTLSRRYPGVQPFKTEQANLFFGRGDDRDRLLNLILLEKLMVLFGKSGYGKSSLLNAGLIPDLEAENQRRKLNYVPISVRFTAWGGASDDSLVNKFLLQLRKAVPEIEPQAQFLQNTEGVHQTLWVECKLRQTPRPPKGELRTPQLPEGEFARNAPSGGRGARFVLLFDQFEEFFTYPIDEQNEFKKQLAELLYADLPAAIWQVKANWTEEQEDFLSQPMDVRAVLAIRADRMSYLDGLKDKLPAILQKRYELKGLADAQAQEAIQEPAQKKGDFASAAFTFSSDALRVMTQKLSETKGAQRSGIEAFQLQILCEYLEDKIIKGEIPNNRIEPAYFEDKIDEIYEGYYQRLIDKLDPSVRKAAQLLIEEDLIYHNEKTGDSRRESRDSGRLLDKEGITQKLLNDLESNFLLRREVNSLGGISYEVSHDTLIAPILASKEERKALEKADAERREARRKQRRLLAILVAAVLALAVVIGVVVYVLKLRNDAVEALKVAEQERTKAEKNLKDFLDAQKAREMTEFKITLQNVKGILKGGNCPPEDMKQAINNIQIKYPNDSDLQTQIIDILNQSTSNNCK